jgi:hypothetical protein
MRYNFDHTKKNSMIKMTVHTVYKKGRVVGGGGVRGKRKKAMNCQSLFYKKKQRGGPMFFESITKYTIKFSLCTILDNTIDTSSFQ